MRRFKGGPTEGRTPGTPAPRITGTAMRGQRPRPEEILALETTEADRLLDDLEALVPAHPAFLEVDRAEAGEAIVFGDTHGDWRSTLAVADRFLAASRSTLLIGLGDYIDRTPSDCPEGSVANALYLLGLAAEFPGRVVLLRGNHESVRTVPVLPHDLPEEVDLLWGPEPDRYVRLLGLLERGPLAARLDAGVFLAHGGFPRGGGDWRAAIANGSEEAVLDLTWTDCATSGIDRGLGAPFTAADLTRFLGAAGTRLFLRGHDPDITGQTAYGGRCLTLHTTRYYERYGGVIFARVPLDRPVHGVQDLTVEHVETEGRRYDAP